MDVKVLSKTISVLYKKDSTSGFDKDAYDP